MIENICALEKIKKLKDNSQDIIFADPPYALGSAVKIGKDGKPYYKEARDFMTAWQMPDEKFWESFFQEASRVLKYGGRVLFFGIDRQLFLFQYYAVASGLEIKQSLYWYFISNFPKSADLSKGIDKRLGADREKIATVKGVNNNTSKLCHSGGTFKEEIDITKSKTELGKKYEGLKYSISPLKQVLETVMVFQKPTKNKSTLDDVFAYEDGDDEISVSAWNIDGGRVPTDTDLSRSNNGVSLDENVSSINLNKKPIVLDNSREGRFPPQLFIDKECTSKLDEQSRELKSGSSNGDAKEQEASNGVTPLRRGKLTPRNDSGGASRILHHIEYLDEELDLVIYSPKVSSFERELGCDGFDKKTLITMDGGNKDLEKLDPTTEKFHTLPKGNNHPTLKPIKLMYQIAKLLKTPNPQNVFFPFGGAGSEIIGFAQAGFDPELFECSEISEEYIAIAEARIEAWKDLDINNLESSKKHTEKLSKEDSRQGSFNFE